MSKRAIWTAGILVLALVPAYNIYKVIKKPDQTPAQAPASTPKDSSGKSDAELNDLLEDADVTITFDDGRPTEFPVDERPLNLRAECTSCYDSPETIAEVFIEDPVIASCLKEENVTTLNAIKEFYCMDLAVRSIEGLQHFPNLRKIGISQNSNGRIDFSILPKLEEISVIGKGITTVDVSGNQNLKGLFLNDSPDLTYLDLSNNTALVALQVGLQRGNQLTSIKFPQEPSITKLEIAKTQLTSIDLSRQTNLTFASVTNSPLADIKLPKNSALTELWLFNNQLKRISIPESPELERLNIGDNPLETLKLNQKSLVELTIENTPLTHFSTKGLPNLERLDAYDSNLETLDLSGSPYLKSLGVTATKIKTLDLSDTKFLTELYIRESEIEAIDVSNNKDLEVFQFTESKLLEDNITLGSSHPRK